MRTIQITTACTRERERERDRDRDRDRDKNREREREVGHTSINTTDNGKEIFQC